MGVVLLTESVYLPFLLCIQACLSLEVISLWMGETAVALSFRLMIGVFVSVIYYFRARCEKYASELTHLLKVIFIQDTLVMFLTQGLFLPYTWMAVNLPALLLLSLIHYRDLIRERLLALYHHQQMISIV